MTWEIEHREGTINYLQFSKVGNACNSGLPSSSGRGRGAGKGQLGTKNSLKHRILERRQCQCLLHRLVVGNKWGNTCKVCRKGSAIYCEFSNLVRLTNSFPACHHNQLFFPMVLVRTGNPPTSWIIPLSINSLSNSSSSQEHNFVLGSLLPSLLPPSLRRSHWPLVWAATSYTQSPRTHAYEKFLFTYENPS